MPSDADLDTNIESEGTDDAPESDQPGKQTPREMRFAFDTTSLREDIAKGVREGVAGLFNRSTSAAIPADEQPLAYAEDDDADTRTDKRIHNSQIPLRKTIRELQQFGIGRLTAMQEELSSKKLPFWTEYQKEIETELANIDPISRSDPRTLQLVHDTVAMRHEPERKARYADEFKRQQNQDGDAPAPGGHGGRTSAREGGDKTPTPADLGFDADQIAEIEKFGSPDRFAYTISMGRYKNWSEYAAGHQRMITGQGAKRGLMGRSIPFKRPEFSKGGGPAKVA